jgi:hypothetical protein
VDNSTDQKDKQVMPTASAVLEDGTMVEMLFRPDIRRTLLAIYSAGRWTLHEKVDLQGDTRLVPFSPGNNLIKNEAVLLPSEPKIYGSEGELVSEIQQLIHRYVDFDPAFEKVATYYVLLSWLFPGWPCALGDCEGLSEGAPVVSATGPDPLKALRAPLKNFPIISGFWPCLGSKPALRASSMTV